MALDRRARQGRLRPTRRGRLVLSAVLAVVIGGGILVMRLSAQPASSTAVQHPGQKFIVAPQSPAIEQAWGIRFTALILGGDRGMLDVRYVVVNTSKSARIHGGSVTNPDPQAAVKSLPTFIKEGGGGGAILPTAAMMHFEHFHFQTETVGSGFSILYGNAAGLLHVGDKVTIRMADGLELKHVVVNS